MFLIWLGNSHDNASMSTVRLAQGINVITFRGPKLVSRAYPLTCCITSQPFRLAIAIRFRYRAIAFNHYFVCSYRLLVWLFVNQELFSARFGKLKFLVHRHNAPNNAKRLIRLNASTERQWNEISGSRGLFCVMYKSMNDPHCEC